MSSTTDNAPDTRAQALVGSYVRAGYAQVDPPVLQPAEPFLDLSGEDIRRRMFLTSDPDGSELCLRPDLTIPVSRAYLASANAGKPAGFCYLGPVFRHRDNASSEFVQAGIEFFGRADTAAADAEMVELRSRGDDALRAASAGNPHGRRRPVLGLHRRARPCASVEAPPDQGFQSQVLAETRPRSAHHRNRQRFAGISGRAHGARQLRSEGRPPPRHRSALDCGHRRRRRPLRGRDRRPLPRTGGVERTDPSAARDPRADRALPVDRRRSGRSRGRTAHACRRRADFAGCRTHAARDPHRLSRRARRERARHQILHELWTRLRLLHRRRLRTARCRAPKPRWSPAAATTVC